jgi:UDP-perosamine 4-acetyltransferase
MLGAGGHARVLQELLAEKGYTLHGYVAPAEDSSFEAKWLGGDDTFSTEDPDKYLLLNGVGSIGSTKVRAKVFANYKKLGFNFLAIESNDSIVAPSAVVLEGVQVLRGAIINTGAIVEHDNLIGQNCHVSVGAKLSGDVRVGSGSHIGVGATIIQGVTIGQNCIIGAGAVVLADVPDNHTAVGVPAKNRPNKA